MNLEDQYDRIFKYLFFHLHDKHAAEDLTQEAFLRFLGSRTYRDENRQLQYLYTIARNLCRQYYRDRTIMFSLDEEVDIPIIESFEQTLLDQMILREALQKLSSEEKELLFLRYVNPVRAREDKLIVTKLDRFARTAAEGGALVKELQERGVTIHILNMGVVDDTPMGRLMMTMLLAFADFERDMIVERTQAGRAIARANGVRVDGRPRKFTGSSWTTRSRC